LQCHWLCSSHSSATSCADC